MKKKLTALLSICLLFGAAFCLGNSIRSYSIATVAEVSPRIWTNIIVSIKSDDDFVYGCARNTFTLFPSTVAVEVRLYYSETYTDDYTKMTFAASSSVADLDMNQEVSTCALKTKTYYWRAVAVYSENGGAKNTVQSDTVLIKVS